MTTPTLLTPSQAVKGQDINPIIPVSFASTGLTTSTEIIIAMVPLITTTPYNNMTGDYWVSILNSTTSQLDIKFTASINQPNITGTSFKFTPIFVNDSGGTITLANILSNYSLKGYLRTTTPHPYIVVTLAMTAGLYASSSSLTFNCNAFSQSLLGADATITQLLGQNITALTGTYASNSTFVINAVSTGFNFAYFPLSSNVVGQYSIPSNGQLSVLSPATVPVVANPVGIGFTPNRAYAFVCNSGTNVISQFSVNTTTGQLTANSPATFTTSSSPNDIVISPNGLYAYIATRSSNLVVVANISAGGLLSANSTNSATNCYSVAIHPSGNYVYASLQSSSAIAQFSVGVGGALTPLSPATVGIGTGNTPLRMAITASGNYLYAACGNSIAAYSIASGALTLINNYTVAAGPVTIALHPSGNYLYSASETNPGTINQFSINSSTGVLTALSPASITTGAIDDAIGIAINGAGTYAYVGCDGGASVYQLAIAGNGTLSALSPASFSLAGVQTVTII